MINLYKKIPKEVLFHKILPFIGEINQVAAIKFKFYNEHGIFVRYSRYDAEMEWKKNHMFNVYARIAYNKNNKDLISHYTIDFSKIWRFNNIQEFDKYGMVFTSQNAQNMYAYLYNGKIKRNEQSIILPEIICLRGTSFKEKQSRDILEKCKKYIQKVDKNLITMI